MTFLSLFIRDTCPDTVPRSSSTLLSVQGGAFFSVRNERTFGSMRNLSIHLPAFERTSCSRLHEEAITTSAAKQAASSATSASPSSQPCRPCDDAVVRGQRAAALVEGMPVSPIDPRRPAALGGHEAICRFFVDLWSAKKKVGGSSPQRSSLIGSLRRIGQSPRAEFAKLTRRSDHRKRTWVQTPRRRWKARV